LTLSTKNPIRERSFYIDPDHEIKTVPITLNDVLEKFTTTTLEYLIDTVNNI